MKEPERSVMNRGASPTTLPVNKITAPKTPGKGTPAIQQIMPTVPGQPAVSGASALQRKPLGTPPAKEVKPTVTPQGKRPITPEGHPSPTPKEGKKKEESER